MSHCYIRRCVALLVAHHSVRANLSYPPVKRHAPSCTCALPPPHHQHIRYLDYPATVLPLRRHYSYLAARRVVCPAARRLTAAHHNEVQLTKWIVTSSDCSRALTPRWGPSPLCRPPRGYNALAPIRYLDHQANVLALRDVTPVPRCLTKRKPQPRGCTSPSLVSRQLEPPPVKRLAPSCAYVLPRLPTARD